MDRDRATKDSHDSRHLTHYVVVDTAAKGKNMLPKIVPVTTDVASGIDAVEKLYKNVRPRTHLTDHYVPKRQNDQRNAMNPDLPC